MEREQWRRSRVAKYLKINVRLVYCQCEITRLLSSSFNRNLSLGISFRRVSCSSIILFSITYVHYSSRQFLILDKIIIRNSLECKVVEIIQIIYVGAVCKDCSDKTFAYNFR